LHRQKRTRRGRRTLLPAAPRPSARPRQAGRWSLTCTNRESGRGSAGNFDIPAGAGGARRAPYAPGAPLRIPLRRRDTLRPHFQGIFLRRAGLAFRPSALHRAAPAPGGSEPARAGVEDQQERLRATDPGESVSGRAGLAGPSALPPIAAMTPRQRRALPCHHQPATRRQAPRRPGRPGSAGEQTRSASHDQRSVAPAKYVTPPTTPRPGVISTTRGRPGPSGRTSIVRFRTYATESLPPRAARAAPRTRTLAPAAAVAQSASGMVSHGAARAKTGAPRPMASAESAAASSPAAISAASSPVGGTAARQMPLSVSMYSTEPSADQPSRRGVMDAVRRNGISRSVPLRRLISQTPGGASGAVRMNATLPPSGAIAGDD